MANKLELTWYGKDEPIRIEPRLLIENAVLSNTAADPDTENMIIHGDNLLALKAINVPICCRTCLGKHSFLMYLVDFPQQQLILLINR